MWFLKGGQTLHPVFQKVSLVDSSCHVFGRHNLSQLDCYNWLIDKNDLVFLEPTMSEFYIKQSFRVQTFGTYTDPQRQAAI